MRFIYRTRARTNRFRRRIFPSPLELRLIELAGGKVRRFPRIKDPRTHFPAAVVVSMGPMLKSENYKREVRYGKYYVDFSNDLHRIIEVDGAAYHMDVVADMDREIYIKTICPPARFLRIKAYEIYNNPAAVQTKLRKFLS